LNKLNYIFALFIIIFVACKKPVIPAKVTIIDGPQNLCAGLNVTYTIDAVKDATYYLWTVPEDSKIISGQGTTSIIINFGQKTGNICVRSNNAKSEGEVKCIEIKHGGISNQWCQIQNFLGGERQLGAAFSINNKGYFGTGFNNINAKTYNDFWEYDPDENTWAQKADFTGVVRQNAIGFAINNKGYLGTGLGASTTLLDFLSDFWEYNPLSNNWLQKANYPFKANYCFAFTLGNKGYVGSGAYITGPVFSVNDFYEFDPNLGVLGTWTKKANLLLARSSSIGFSIGNKGYYGTGASQSIKDNKFMEYDPVDLTNGLDINGNPLGKWVYKTDFPGAKREGAVGFAINNKGYIGTGSDVSIGKNDFWEYNPITDLWVQKASLNTAGRFFASAFVIGNNVYVGTGNDNNKSLKDFWVYGQ